MGRRSRSGNGHVAGKVDASVEEGVRQRNRIGVNGRDDLRAGREVLRKAVTGCEAQAEKEQEPAPKRG